MEYKMEYKNEALMVCHQAAHDLYELGVIDDDEMHEYDNDCLVSKHPVQKRKVNSRHSAQIHSAKKQQA